MRHLARFLATVAVAAVLAATDASAEASHHRTGWYAGLGFGPARGSVWLTGLDDPIIERTGSSPQIRAGRMLDRRFGLGIEAQTWFVEGGTIGDDVILQLKARFTGHLWALAGTWYPGDTGFWRGFFVRAGAGPAIANYAIAIPDPEDPESGQELQTRIDEWGWGLVAAVGWEVPVSPHFAAGVQFSSNHLWIGDNLDRLWFGAPVVHLGWNF